VRFKYEKALRRASLETGDQEARFLRSSAILKTGQGNEKKKTRKEEIGVRGRDGKERQEKKKKKKDEKPQRKEGKKRKQAQPQSVRQRWVGAEKHMRREERGRTFERENVMKK
jgi:hypothetical protein